MSKMQLLPNSIAKKLPALYSQEKKGDGAIAHLKLFCPWNSWSWFATEYDPEDKLFFGLVVGDFTELGYFSLEEIESVTGPLGLKIERDKYFTPKILKECRDGKS